MTKLNILNEVFDHIFVITISSFVDRIEKMKSRLNGVDYQFFEGVYGGDLNVDKYRKYGSKLTRGQLSCAASHLKLYEKIVNENLRNVLILEDDCIFTENLVYLKNCYEQLPEKYSAFYLGYSECYTEINYSNNLYEVFSGNISQTHAMSVTIEGASKLLEINQNLLFTADGLFCELFKRYDTKAYLPNPIMILQDNQGETSTLVEIDKKYGFGF